MQKFRAAVIAATLAIMFFIPMSVMGEYENLLPKEEIQKEEEPEVKNDTPIYEEPAEEVSSEEFFRIFDMESEKIQSFL